jgi:predicted XRE-type DNA-binding protein
MKFESSDKRMLRFVGACHGMYARIAANLHISPSFVSRVARGERHSESVLRALVKELRRIEKMAKWKR